MSQVGLSPRGASPDVLPLAEPETAQTWREGGVNALFILCVRQAGRPLMLRLTLESEGLLNFMLDFTCLTKVPSPGSPTGQRRLGHVIQGDQLSLRPRTRP